MNIDPFTSKKHILLIPWPIWTIFATLDVPCGRLQKQIKTSKGNETIWNIHKSLSLSVYDRLIYLNMFKPMGSYFHEHNLDILSHIPCPKMNSHQLDNKRTSFFSFNIDFFLSRMSYTCHFNSYRSDDNRKFSHITLHT